MSNKERTFIAIKPDGVQRGLVSKIIKQFEQRGYKLVAMKMVKATRQHLEVHYQDLSKKPFFPALIDYMASGPIVAMVWEGLKEIYSIIISSIFRLGCCKTGTCYAWRY